MKYTTIHINEDRLESRLAIDATMSSLGIPRQDFKFCNGTVDDLDSWYASTGVKNIYPGMLKRGEIGIWQSLASVWSEMDDDTLVFEDDALLHADFSKRFRHALLDLPEDADFLTLFVPEEQRQDYEYIVRYDEEGIWHSATEDNKYIFDIGSDTISRAYSGWGGQAILFTKKGADALLQIAQSRGMYTTSDCFLYLQAHAGAVNGYSMMPKYYDTVYIDKNTKTLIQDTER